MTDKIKSAIETFEDYKENGYDLRASNGELFDIAIRSLKAWEEVLQKLEEREIEYSNNEFKPLADNMYYWGTRNLGIRDAINIINQKLAEIEGG